MLMEIPNNLACFPWSFRKRIKNPKLFANVVELKI